jgi:hypothetical protein
MEHDASNETRRREGSRRDNKTSSLQHRSTCRICFLSRPQRHRIVDNAKRPEWQASQPPPAWSVVFLKNCRSAKQSSSSCATMRPGSSLSPLPAPNSNTVGIIARKSNRNLLIAIGGARPVPASRASCRCCMTAPLHACARGGWSSYARQENKGARETLATRRPERARSALA